MDKKIVEEPFKFYEDAIPDISGMVKLKWIENESHWSIEDTPEIEVHIDLDDAPLEKLEEMVGFFLYEIHKTIVATNAKVEIKFGESHYDGDLNKLIIQVDEISLS